MAETVVQAATLREVAKWASGPIDVQLVAGETVRIDHDLGRRVGHVVVRASGPVQTWEVDSGNPYRVLALSSNISMAVQILLV